MIYIGSLKYSPVYKSHCCAFGKACEKEGYAIKYLFSREYEWMLPKEIKEKTLFVGRSTSIPEVLLDTLNVRNSRTISKNILRDKPTHVYLQNYHLLNHYVSRLCHRIGSKFVYHVHEPFVVDKSAHGGLARYWLYLDEWMESRLLEETDIAIVSSKEASRLFDSHYPEFEGKKLEIPLIYEDLGNNILSRDERKYITFVGPVMPSKGPEVFLRIVDYSNKHDLGYSFLLLSRSKVNDPDYYNRANLTVRFGKRISDEEYGEFMGKSLVVLIPYKRITQSSVLLVSYMYGTPVVSTDVGGLPEFVVPGKTGYVLQTNSSALEWIECISLLTENLEEVSKYCRKFFIDDFSGRAWKRYLAEMLE